MARSFWRLTAAAYWCWLVAQGFSVYNDLAASPLVSWCQQFPVLLLVRAAWPWRCSSTRSTKPGHLDALVALDFVQGVLVCVAAYLYFFYLPKADATKRTGALGLDSVLRRLRFCRGSFRGARRRHPLAGLRARCSAGWEFFWPSPDASMPCTFTGRDAVCSTGAWFDLLWSALLVIPILIATTWKQVEAPEPRLRSAPAREANLHRDLLSCSTRCWFCSCRCASRASGWDWPPTVVLLSFVCSSARLLVTQNRLLVAKEALRREASRDGLTSLWNRKAILAILERDLLRAERDHAAGRPDHDRRRSL